MSLYQENLIESAIAVWSTGRDISCDLAAQLLDEGLDVSTLEEKHKQEAQ